MNPAPSTVVRVSIALVVMLLLLLPTLVQAQLADLELNGLKAVTGDGEVTLVWNNPNNPDIAKYQVKWWLIDGPEPGWTDISGSRASTTSHLVTGLTNGAIYYFRVRAMAGTLGWIPSDIVKASPVPSPAKPTGVTATAGSRQVTLRWTNLNNEDITKYQLKYWTGASESGGWTDISGSRAGTTSHLVTGLTNGVEYSFRVRAMAGTAEGRQSDVVKATPVPPPAPAKPTGITRTAGSREVTLRWTNPRNPYITKYQVIYWRHGQNSGWIDIPNSGKDTVSHTVTGLRNDLTVSFRIRAVADTAVGRNSDQILATPRVTAPATPVGFTATPGNARVTLSWTNPNNIDITKYQVRYWRYARDSGWVDIPNSGKDTVSHTVTGLDNGFTHGFRIRAVAGTVRGIQSGAVSATPRFIAPAKPVGFTATPGVGQVTLSWTNPNNIDITKYQVKYWRGASESGDWIDIRNSGASTTSHLVTGLTNGVESSFRVRAIVVTAVGIQSDVVKATPVPPPAPAKPTGVRQTVGSRQITLRWTNPRNPYITKYQVKYWKYGQDSGWVDIPNSGKDTVSHTVKGLRNYYTYSFRIRAVAGTVVGIQSDEILGSPGLLRPAKPVGFTVTPGVGQVTLSWTNPDNIDIKKYQLQAWRIGGGAPWQWTDIPNSGASTTSHIVTGLTNGVEYGFRIQVLVDVTKTEISNFLTATPTEGLAAPTGLAATPGKHRPPVTLSWNDPDSSDISGYEIQYALEANGLSSARWTSISGSSASTTSHVVTGLTYSTEYIFRIRTLVGQDKGLPSAIIRATTPDYKNRAPTGTVTISGTPTQGQTLAADTSTISDPDGPSSLTFSYQWKRDGTDIRGATQATYNLVQADVGAKITVAVSWTDDGGASETLTSAATSDVADINDPPTGAVIIDGTPAQGQTLTAITSGISDPDGPSNLRFSYQWKRDGTNIIGAIRSTYTLTRADVGKAITVTALWTDSGGKAEALISAATSSVAGVTLSKRAVTVTEASGSGNTTTYTLVLDVQPSGEVTITPTSSDTGVATVSPASLTFTTSSTSV